jgi:GT2 family glycosyltransferase
VTLVSFDFSVIIVTHNSEAPLRNCLHRLNAASGGRPYELLIVDNASTDRSASLAREIAPQARIIVNRRNLGFAAGCNRGAAQAAGKYLLFLNPDVELDEGAINALMAVADRSPAAGVLAGRMRYPDGRFQATCRNFPTLSNILFSRGAGFLSVLDKGKYTLPDSDSVMEVPAAAGTMMLIDAALFKRAGWFDERFFMFMEDTDLCYRLTRLGRVNFFVPSAEGVHRWGQGSAAGRFKRVWYQHWSVWKYFRKRRVRLPAAVGLFLLLLANYIRSLAMLCVGKGSQR